jgi:hypothetical protein
VKSVYGNRRKVLRWRHAKARWLLAIDRGVTLEAIAKHERITLHEAADKLDKMEREWASEHPIELMEGD